MINLFYKQTKGLLIILLIVPSFQLISQKSATVKWGDFQYDSVVTYLYNFNLKLEDDPHSLIANIDQNRLGKENLQCVCLMDWKKSKKLNRLIKTQLFTKQVLQDQFEPHHGIVYYYQNNVVAHVSIDFINESAKIVSKTRTYLLNSKVFEKNDCWPEYLIFKSYLDLDAFENNL